MFANIVFAVAALAVSAVSALPSPTDLDTSSALAARWFSPPQCLGDQFYCGWNKECACNPGWSFNAIAGLCTPPPLVELICEIGEICICAHSPSNWCPFNQHDTRCANDGQAILICIEETVIPVVLPEKCPPVQHCSTVDQVWVPASNSCECKKGMSWDTTNNRCQWPTLPQPTCHETTYCASDPYTWCAWDHNNSLCHDNGHHKTICCHPTEIQQQCKKQWGN